MSWLWLMRHTGKGGCGHFHGCPKGETGMLTRAAKTFSCIACLVKPVKFDRSGYHLYGYKRFSIMSESLRQQKRKSYNRFSATKSSPPFGGYRDVIIQQYSLNLHAEIHAGWLLEVA